MVFSCVLPVAGNDGARNREVMQMNTWLQGWCKQQHFVVFDRESVYTALTRWGPLVSEEKRDLSSGLSRAH